MWSCQPPHRSEASASLGLSKTPGSSHPQQGEAFPQKALPISPKPLAPRPAVVVPTRICYFYVILHMKKIGDIEFVQIGGVLQQKQHVGQSEPGSRGWAGGLRVPGLEGARPGAAQRPGVSSREWRAPGVRSGLCPGKATSRGGVGTVAHQTVSPSPRHTADEHRWMFIWGCGQTRGSHLRPPTHPHTLPSAWLPDTKPTAPRALATARPPVGGSVRRPLMRMEQAKDRNSPQRPPPEFLSPGLSGTHSGLTSRGTFYVQRWGRTHTSLSSPTWIRRWLWEQR